MTFSIVARDEVTAQLGVATATHAYGAGIVANHARAGVGAAATQAFIEVGYGPRGIDLMAAGTSADDALDTLVSRDPDRDIRQVAFVDAAGVAAKHTGARCVPSCGSVTEGSAVATGNMLANDRVLPAMVEAFGAAEGDLAERLIAALDAGDGAGGDARGRMSASLQVVGADPVPNTWQGTIRDLRADFSASPIDDLRTSLKVSRAYDAMFEYVFAPGAVTGDEPRTGAALEAALGGLAATQHDLGDDPEPTVWKGVLLVRAGKIADGCRLIDQAIAARPELAGFIDGLTEVGILTVSADEALRVARSA